MKTAGNVRMIWQLVFKVSGRRMYLGFSKDISDIMNFWDISMQGVIKTA